MSMLNGFNHRSDPDLFHKTTDDIRTYSRKSMDTISRKNEEESVLFIIKLQKSIIDSYKSQLDEAKDEISHCKENFDIIKETNDFDPDNITNSLIHHVKSREEKQSFKNAIIFMQNKLKFVLNKIEQENEEKEEARTK